MLEVQSLSINLSLSVKVRNLKSIYNAVNMKTIIRLIPLLSLFCLIYCDPPFELTNDGDWNIKNMTDKSITVKRLSNGTEETFLVSPGGSVKVFEISLYLSSGGELPVFEDLIHNTHTGGYSVFDKYSNYSAIQIFAGDNVLLKEWNWADADAADLPEFFDESHWRKYTQKKSKEETRISWIFDFYQ